MERKTKIILTCLVTIAFAMIIVFASNLAKPITGNAISTNEKSDYSNFVNCLNEQKVVLFGSLDNSLVQAQLQIFGESAKNISLVDCSLNPEKCTGIMVYPSWKINEQIIHGGLSIGTLSKISGCE